MYLTCLEQALDEDIDGVRAAHIRKVMCDWSLELRAASLQPQSPERYREITTLLDACEAADKVVRIVGHRLALNRRAP
jgi:type III secretion system YseE family protein